MGISDTVFRPGYAVIESQNPVEQHPATDCTGISGTTNRTLTTTKTILNATIVVVDSIVMYRGTQINITGNVITFTDALLDSSLIEVY